MTFNSSSMTKTEVIILNVIYTEHALSPWQIYSNVIRYLVDLESKKPKRIQDLEDMSIIGYSSKHFEIDKRKCGGVEKVAKYWRKVGVEIPSFTKIMPNLISMENSGMAMTKRIGNKEYYFISPKAKQWMDTQTKD